MDGIKISNPLMELKRGLLIAPLINIKHVPKDVIKIARAKKVTRIV